MGGDKRDWLIGVVAFIVLVLVFSLQAFPLQDATHANESQLTGSGAQTAGNDSSVIFPSGGDIPVEPELDEPENVESPQTGDDSVMYDFYMYVLIIVLCYCAVSFAAICVLQTTIWLVRKLIARIKNKDRR